MKLFFALLALCVAYTLAKCPEPSGDLKHKQAEIQKIIERINKPYTKSLGETNYVLPERGLGKLDKHQVFSLFDEKHWPEAEKVLGLMMHAKDFNEFIYASTELLNKVNEDMFAFAFITAIVHRPDTQGLTVPRIQDIYPDKFFTKAVIYMIKKAVNRGEQNVHLNGTTIYWNNLEENNRLKYFTEDMGMNAHHYHWHTVNPAIWTPELGPAKDRQGEAFYWMHRQMVARYNAERLSNNMKRVEPFEDWHDDIDEGYASHLIIDSTGYNYMFRPDDLHLSDLTHISKDELKEYKERIADAIDLGYVIAKNRTKIPIREDPFGTDILGHMIESTRQTLNRPYYGNLHCNAHEIAARITDPREKYSLDNGVMYDVATSARDPLFYQWHKCIDNLFQRFKNTLTPYTPEEVNWAEVKIDKVGVIGETSNKENTLNTFWNENEFKIGKHHSFTGESTAEVTVKHLDHEPFKYTFEIVNNAGDSKEAMVRVYLVPKYNELGKKFTPNQQRSMLIELDKFITKLKPGKNVVERTSKDSSVTVPTKSVFAPFETLDGKDQCNCGWPEYLLLPRGKPEGMTFRLIVFVSNWQEDKLHDDVSCLCKGSPSYCRYLYQKVADKRPIGYPFDRKIDTPEWNLIEKKVHNIHAQDIKIKFTDKPLVTKDIYAKNFY